MKKTFVLFMVTVLLFTSFTNVFANSDNVYLQKNEDGKYVKAKGKAGFTKAVMTDDEDVYCTVSDDLVKSYGDIYVQVEKAEANLKDIDRIRNIATTLDLPKEVVEDLLIDSQNAIDSDNDSSMVSIIAPKKITNSKSTGITSLGRSPETDYYKHDGYYLKDITYSVTNIDTPTEQIKKGVTVKDYIDSAVKLIVTGLGLKSLKVAIIDGSNSMLDYLLDKFSVTEVKVESDPDSFVEMNITYDRVRKYTYVSITGKEKDYRIGSKTLYVTIDNVYTKIHTIIDGKGETAIKNNGKNQKLKTKNYDDPADISIANYAGGYWDEAYLKCKEGDAVFKFD